MKEAPLASPSEKCRIVRTDTGVSVSLCADLGNQLSPQNVGDAFKFVYGNGCPAVTCLDGSVLMYCPFCGEKIGEEPKRNQYINADWREFHDL